MLPELDAFKVLFYEESVGVVTSGHLTKMTVAPFDPQWPITPYYTQTSRLYLLQNQSYCRLNFYMAGIGNFAFFLRKIVEIIKFFVYIPKMTWWWLKHIFRPITDRSSLYTAGVTRIQNAVLCRIGGRGHFRSRDKDGGHTIRSAANNLTLFYKLISFFALIFAVFLNY